MRGNLSSTTLPAIVRALYADRKSGVLHLSTPTGARRVVFREGRILRLESDVEGEVTGEDRLEDVPRSAEDGSIAVRPARPSAIARALLAAGEGAFHFEEGPDPLSAGDDTEIPAAQWILDGVRQVGDADQLRRLVGDLRAVLRPTPSSPLPIFTVKMTPAERSLLKATREHRPFSTEQLLASSRLGEVETLRAVYALVAVGLLEVGASSRASPADATEASGGTSERGPEPAPTPRFGRYELQRRLVREGTREVFRARDPEVDRIVAIEIWDATAGVPEAAREEHLAIFHEVLERARQLYHPGIVSMLEQGLTEDGRSFVVTEHVEGLTLSDLLSSGPLAAKHALELATQVAEALAYAHARGIVHRRVQPSKIRVTVDGRARLTDFGMPPPAGAPSPESLPYVAPEENATGRSDARADVYSFGAVCYRMLTGALPFPEASERPFDPPAPLETYGVEADPRLSDILLRCLARTPGERFDQAGELLSALRALVTTVPTGKPSASASAPAAVKLTPAPARGATAPEVPSLSRTPPPPTPPTPAIVSTTAEPPPEVPSVEADVAAPVGASSPGETPVASEPPDNAASQSSPPSKAPRRRFPKRPAARDSAASGATGSRAGRGWIRLATLSSIAAALVAGGAWAFVARDEPWRALPAAPTGDVTVRPVTLSLPPPALVEELLAGPSDEALFQDARSLFERSELEASRSVLVALLERRPDFPGARALLDRVDAERRAAAERRLRAEAVEPEVPTLDRRPSEADLFSDAESAFARGELAVSRTKLEALLEVNPSFEGAAELMETIDYRIWTTTLPRRFAARHNHRLGGCDGVLTLTQEGLSFRSDDHEWAWPFDELVSMERPDPVNFNVVTGDRDLLGILSNKRFKFRLEQAFSGEDWRFFQRAVDERGASATTAL